ncbi:hypothetical protein MBM_03235 [Drepanopeziza brunnea f. sp. 'multigermtubi' MB_m1]|uniref:Retrotransposon gag domain-containing protein n=1 Tax=Marssonina brunnea f. sp. multigermtubi (strain MB_m1) TaxID=1072389 RepID=K1WZY6_MARBU|nr:uncharacterized protein MBM_03235 [Drepanopeziza brunnea f. sp. 'multigermtubi' MB_m1]EKD18242.1 hypothetical protein MBM_03235 [Drepanopeziza brunnea f. sp. 'multigermtubi' MB_m1]
MSSHEDDGPSPFTRIAQLESFVEQLRMALRQRKCVLPDPDKFNGTVQRWDTWLPLIKAKLLVDDQLVLAYDNLNKIQEAEDKLLACKQGTDALYIYVLRFERLLHAARCQTWPDANKIIAFRNAWTLFRLFRPVLRILSASGLIGSLEPPSHVNGPSSRRPNGPFSSRPRLTTRAIAARQRARRYRAYRRSRG